MSKGTNSQPAGTSDRDLPANCRSSTVSNSSRNRLESKNSAFTGNASWARIPNSPSGPTRSILKGGPTWEDPVGEHPPGGRSSLSSTGSTHNASYDPPVGGWISRAKRGLNSAANENQENLYEIRPTSPSDDLTKPSLAPIRERSHSGGVLVSTTESRLETTFEPSGEIIQFDVNRFLSRTLSNYDLSDREDRDVAKPFTNTASSTDRDPLRIAQVRNSTPANTPDTKSSESAKIHNSQPKNTNQDEMPRKNLRQVTSSNLSAQSCAYCGHKSSSLTGRSIYCQDCLELTQNSPEITRRLLNSTDINTSSEPATDNRSPDNTDPGLATTTSSVHTSTIGGVPYYSTKPSPTSVPLSSDYTCDSSYNSQTNPISPTEITSLLPRGLTQTPVIIPDGIESESSYDEHATSSKGPPFFTSSCGGNRSTPGGSGSKRMSLTSLTSQSSASRPVCRICQLPGEHNDALISPCRCSGTMQHVHKSCLVHWLEISTRKVCPSPRCELCSYQYKTHHCFKVQKLHMPECGTRDRVLHGVFVLMLLVMIGCASLSIVFLQGDKGNKDRSNASLTGDDVTVISCSILFFLSFFVAVFTQYRADASLCTLCFRCWLINKHWRIKNYDSAEDRAHWVVQHPAEECI